MALYGYACTDCFITAHDSEYEHPRGIDYANIWSTDWDYCADHYAEDGETCQNCDPDGEGPATAYYNEDDGFEVFSFMECDICGTREGGERTRFLA